MPVPVVQLLQRLLLLLGFSVTTGGLGLLVCAAAWPAVLRRSLPELIITSMSSGTALLVLLVFGASALHLPLTTPNLRLLVAGVSVLLAVICAYQLRKARPQPSLVRRFVGKDSLLFLGFLLLLVLTHTLQTRMLWVPNWVDGMLHASLLQKFVATGTIPADRVYHTGFHALALALGDLWALSVPDTILLCGQWASALGGISLFMLARRFIRRRAALYACVTLYGLLLLFPSYLVAWGRYPYMLGLAILPPAIVLSLAWLRSRHGFVLALLHIAALALIHYGALLAWACFVAAYLLWHAVNFEVRRDPESPGSAIASWKIRPSALRRLPRSMGRLALLVMPLILVLVPKAANLLGHPNAIQNMLQGGDSSGGDALAALQLIAAHDYAWAFAWLVVVVLASTWKKPSFWMMMGWAAIAWALAWVQLAVLGITVSSYTNWLVLISLPFCLIAGMAVEDLISMDPDELDIPLSSRARRLVGAGIVAAVLPLGMWLSANLIQPDTILFTSYDRDALAWVGRNAPSDASFLIRSFIWGESLMPSDGGGWIGLLTGRRAIYPSQMGELYDACAYIKQNGIRYIYLGSTMKDAGFDLDLSTVKAEFKPVYANAGVQIMAVACP